MSFVAIFFAGAFLCNAMPHLTAGLRGEVFPSPFSTPHGKGPSSPLVNFLWGMLNALIGLALLVHHPFALGVNVDSPPRRRKRSECRREMLKVCC
ncbi:hypothetical protein [Paraburkholderia strydomiana]|uniref:Uncharacterized protein n=1 Tax=Paraburkholderia strydomiana TaxID=1245417 RepID=A0ABW9BWI2_9BURK